MSWVEQWEDSVKAFWRELVVREGAEEFGDEDVDGDVLLSLLCCRVGGRANRPDSVVIRLFTTSILGSRLGRNCGGGLTLLLLLAEGTLPGAHVRLDEVDFGVPCVLVVALEENVCVWILFQGPELNFYVCSFRCAEGAGDKGPTAGSAYGNDDAVVRP